MYHIRLPPLKKSTLRYDLFRRVREPHWSCVDVYGAVWLQLVLVDAETLLCCASRSKHLLGDVSNLARISFSTCLLRTHSLSLCLQKNLLSENICTYVISCVSRIGCDKEANKK